MSIYPSQSLEITAPALLGLKSPTTNLVCERINDRNPQEELRHHSSGAEAFSPEATTAYKGFIDFRERFFSEVDSRIRKHFKTSSIFSFSLKHSLESVVKPNLLEFNRGVLLNSLQKESSKDRPQQWQHFYKFVQFELELEISLSCVLTQLVQGGIDNFPGRKKPSWTALSDVIILSAMEAYSSLLGTTGATTSQKETASISSWRIS